MNHETPTITAEPRERTGTRDARRIRTHGRLPAVIYGHKKDPAHISLDEKEILTHLTHGTHVINVDVAGTPETCLVKDLQFGWLGDNVIHIDFARVDLNEEVHVKVHIHFVGEPKTAAQAGAILNHALTELDVVCTVANIPEELKIDISEMETQFTVGDIVLPEGIRTELDPETPVVQINFIHAEEAEGEEVAVEGEAGTEPEVITEAKPEDEATEGD